MSEQPAAEKELQPWERNWLHKYIMTWLITYTSDPDICSCSSSLSLLQGITVLLSLTVFMLLVAEIMPATSDSVPLIGGSYLYVCVCVCNIIMYYCRSTRRKLFCPVEGKWHADRTFFRQKTCLNRSNIIGVLRNNVLSVLVCPSSGQNTMKCPVWRLPVVKVLTMVL